MPASTSALCVTSVPASVTGDEPPAIAIERMLTATCSRAPVMMISHVSWTSLSGLTGQVMKLMIGRALSFSRPPATAAAISTSLRESQPLPEPMKPCLDVLVIHASAWCRCTTRWSMSSATTARS